MEHGTAVVFLSLWKSAERQVVVDYHTYAHHTFSYKIGSGFSCYRFVVTATCTPSI